MAETIEINKQKITMKTKKIAAKMVKIELEKAIDQRISKIIKNPEDEISKIEAKVLADIVLNRYLNQ